jgi:hypothetical protein
MLGWGSTTVRAALTMARIMKLGEATPFAPDFTALLEADQGRTLVADRPPARRRYLSE